ncbi:probable cytochrome P450 6a13 [Sitodiplosis mosellana]|uniref:probable cytochrome P450 6a13 n=1 Tax=Sitodiplosis mosellana TaxID=263140 RepID=UPI002443D773|nr:probable cytochrome P450 6a13 [Sitodiplosis mosellana]
MFVILFLLGVVTLFYVWLKWHYTFWKRNKVAGPKPTLFVGNIGSSLNFSEHWGVITTDWYREYTNEPYIGYYKLFKPAILVRNPDLIKDIMITNFNSFRNNDKALSKKQNPLLATNPEFMQDEEWREGRKMMLKLFTQNKIRSIIPVMDSVGADFVKYIKSFPANTDLNAKEISVQFTTENVIKCTFSIDPGCFNKEQESEFLKAGKKVYTPSSLVALKFLSLEFMPKWAMDIIPNSFLSASVDRLFRTLVETNKASRSKNSQRQDILQILLKLQAKHNFDDTHLTGHTLSLFVEGRETSSTLLSYAMYELALNTHCQKTALDEITRVLSKYDGQITVEGLREMIYINGILYEAMRMHPPSMVMAKICTQRYTLPRTSAQSEPITIDPGTVVNINIAGIHMDPKYYPNPQEFIPERFNELEQLYRHKGTFLGFGEGPRICLGQRFAITQVKVALVHIIQNFHIKRSPNQKPIVIDPQTLVSFPRDGILVRLKTR